MLLAFKPNCYCCLINFKVPFWLLEICQNVNIFMFIFIAITLLLSVIKMNHFLWQLKENMKTLYLVWKNDLNITTVGTLQRILGYHNSFQTSISIKIFKLFLLFYFVDLHFSTLNSQLQYLKHIIRYWNLFA